MPRKEYDTTNVESGVVVYHPPEASQDGLLLSVNEIYDFINGPITKTPESVQMQERIKLQLTKPAIHALSRKKPNLENDSKEFAQAYLPFAVALKAFMRRVENGDFEAMENMRGFLEWYKTQCTMCVKHPNTRKGEKVVIHPHIVAQVLGESEMNRGNEEQNECDAAGSIMGLAAVYVGSVVSQQDRSPYSSFKNIFDTEAPIVAKQLGIKRNKYRGSHTELQRKKWSDQVTQYLENEGGAVYMWHRNTGSPLLEEAVNVIGYVIASEQRDKKRNPREGVHCEAIVDPTEAVAVMGWHGQRGKQEALDKARKRIGVDLETIRENGGDALSGHALETCVRFLTNELPPDASEKIASLTHHLRSATRGLHSLGHIDQSESMRRLLLPLGITKIEFNQTGTTYRVTLNIASHSFDVCINGDGSCRFPEGFIAPEARIKL